MAKRLVDHRRAERYQLQVPARIDLIRDLEVEESIDLITSDICSGGAFFRTENSLPLGTEVRVEMILPLKKVKKINGKHAHIRVSGSVIRTTEKGMAICFEDDYVISPWEEKGGFAQTKDAMETGLSYA